MRTTSVEGLLSPSDIADLAGVSRAAVSNWRKRIPDFPQPSGGTADKPLFATSDISEWLRRHPDKDKAAGGEAGIAREWDSALWGIANDLRGSIPVDRFGVLVLETAAASAKGIAISEFDDVPNEVQLNLRNAIESIPVTELARVVDNLLERTSRAQGKSAGSLGFVGSRTSKLLASLASSMKHGTLYDPVCGVGVALLQAVELGARPDRIAGEDISETAIRITEARASLRGIEIETQVGDILLTDADTALKADVIVAEPPLSLRMPSGKALLDPRLTFGVPSHKNLDGFWPQHVVNHLAEGGVGYVITTPGFLFRGGSDAEIRANLIRNGWVKAVVSLPGRMLPYTSIPLALLVLQQTGGEDVLLVDGADCDNPETQVALWLSDESKLGRVPHQYVQVQELVEGDSVLNPARWIEQAPVSASGVRSDYSAARTDLEHSAAQLNRRVAELGDPSPHSQNQLHTIAELIEAGALQVVSAKPISAYKSPSSKGRVIDAAAIRRRELPQLDGLEPADDPAITLPGDVLVSTMNGIQTLVDVHGGLLPAGSIFRVRVLDQRVLDPNYLAEVIRGDWNLRFAAGATIPRVPIRDIEVPVIPIEDQRATYAAISEARELHDLADRVSEASDSLRKTMLTALRHGIDLNSPAERRAE